MKNNKNKFEGCGISATLIGLGRWDLGIVNDMTFFTKRDMLVFVNETYDKFCHSFYSGGTTGMGQDKFSFYDMNKKRHDGKPMYALVKVFKDEKEVVKYLEQGYKE